MCFAIFHVKVVKPLAPLPIWAVSMMMFLALFVGISDKAYAGQCDITGTTWLGNEAYNTTIPLQMPFISGQTWRVGGGGSFYGNGLHCNPNNDYYATDWNRTDSTTLYSPVLPVAKGSIVQATCAPTDGYGCRVIVEHANGFRTRYAHLYDIIVFSGPVDISTLIGHVGSSGTPSPHLHLSFLHFEAGAFNSRCWNGGFGCISGNTPYQPQGECLNPDRYEITQWRIVTRINLLEQLATIPTLDEQRNVALKRVQTS